MTGNRSEIDPNSDESAIARVRMLAFTAPLSDSFAADLERVCNIASRAPNQPLSDALTGCATALNDFIERVFQHRDGSYYWGTDPTHEEVQAALKANNEARAALAAIPSAGGVEPQDLGASSGFDPARMTMFLEILSAAGGEADASESSWNWINAFLEEHEKRYPDTFNEAIDAGYVDWSHDSDSDNSTIRLTATGRAALGGGQ